ncbi:hypothetical protein ACUNWD_05755 [Sunxiuqinia sp. A32]|uniref:hypothetical protein n=1 Tax=Sunxiuqinia sp. A32 TaxID=3461496 RepID=UPI0040467CEC
MDQKKLLQIIKKDLLELNELTEELTNNDTISKLEIEIALSKSKLVMQEFELLKEQSASFTIQSEKLGTPIKSEVKSKSELDNAEKEEYRSEKEEAIEEISVLENDPMASPKTNEIKEDKLEVEKEAPSAENQDTIEPTKQETPQPEAAESELVQEEEKLEEEFETSDQENEEESDEKIKIVGERFTKEKSLNDVMSDSKTLDQKFATSSIQKIETAIGLNDRFQYIRELFNGDSDLFRSTVQQLDEMSNINEAVNHLSTNFKWKKNETSLKFVQLVKRRFIS